MIAAKRSKPHEPVLELAESQKKKRNMPLMSGGRRWRGGVPLPPLQLEVFQLLWKTKRIGCVGVSACIAKLTQDPYRAVPWPTLSRPQASR